MGSKFGKIINRLKSMYKKRSRLLLFLIMILFYFFILLQSYVAEPRNLSIVFTDTWEMLFFIIPFSLIILKVNVRDLLPFGVFYLVLGFLIAFLKFPSFIKSEYATISFLIGIWFVGDWLNFRIFKQSIFSELVKGNYYIAFGLFLSTVVLGSIVEFLNAPVGLWWYNYPFPSIQIYSFPLFLAAFGWFPWILAMFVFFYPFALQKPE